MSRTGGSGLFATAGGSHSDTCLLTADEPGANVQTTIPTPAARFMGLEAMRGAAALVVGIAHSQTVLLATPASGNAALAVDFFFMLSGFVLAHGYAAKLSQGDYLRTYLWRRVIRLYPLIAVGTVLGFVPWYIHGGNGSYLVRLLGQGILLLPEPWSTSMDEGIFPLNPPAWSLFFEMVASVLFGLGVWRSKRPGPLLACVFAGSAAMLLAIAKGKAGSGWAFRDLGWGFARLSYGFGAGVALYRFRKSLPVPGLPLPFLMASLFLLLLIPTPSKILLGFKLFAVFPLLILSGSRIKNGFGRSSYWAGQLSYPFYIVHWPVYYWILGAMVVTGVHPPRILVAAAGLLSAIIASFLIFAYVDNPARKWLTTLRTRLNYLP